MTDINALWPSADRAVVGSTADACIRIAIRSGATNVADPDDAEFWSRVATEAPRIAVWVRSGLGIADGARALPTAVPDAAAARPSRAEARRQARRLLYRRRRAA